ncbi:MAG: NTPase [Candidatus Bipolaricaulaceae bacterium]
MGLRIAITGQPGVGKTTLVQQVLAQVPLQAGGMITREIRKVGRRVGFAVIDVATGREGVLAHVHQTEGPRVGRYRVNLADLEGIGVAAVDRAIATCPLVVVDEVAPMELKSARFVAAVERALGEAEHLLVCVHRASSHHLTYRIRHQCHHLVRLTKAGRDQAAQQVVRLLSEQG